MFGKRFAVSIAAFMLAVGAATVQGHAQTMPGGGAQNCGDLFKDECRYNCTEAIAACQNEDHPTIPNQTCYAHLHCPVDACILGPWVEFTCTYTIS